MMTQATFSRFIGVSRKTITTMKKNGEIVFLGNFVDEHKSIIKLRSLGRLFDENSKLIKTIHNKEEDKIKKEEPTIFSNEVIPEKNLSNISDEDYAERKKLMFEAETLRKEVESRKINSDINHDTEIKKLDLTEARLIKEYWLGVSLRQKTELAAEELVYKKDVDSAEFALGRKIREKLKSRPNLAFKMVGKNIEEIQYILDEDQEDILNLLLSTDVL